MSSERESSAEDDIVLAEAASHAPAHSALAARVDVSGLLAIAASGPKPFPVPLDDSVLLDGVWPASADRGDESLLSRHSA